MKSFLLTVSFVFLILSLSQIVNGAVFFSSLRRSLVVTASPTQGQVLKAGEDSITVTWGLNQTVSDEPVESYKNVKIKLCYAPISQVDRKWRKTVDNLKNDKTCQFSISNKPYQRNNQSIEWKIERDLPTATYFVRAYAYNSVGEEIAYGQTTNEKKSINLFEIQGISGRHLSLDIASICFSVFALVSLIGFFLIEKSKSKKPMKK